MAPYHMMEQEGRQRQGQQVEGSRGRMVAEQSRGWNRAGALRGPTAVTVHTGWPSMQTGFPQPHPCSPSFPVVALPSASASLLAWSLLSVHALPFPPPSCRLHWSLWLVFSLRKNKFLSSWDLGPPWAWVLARTATVEWLPEWNSTLVGCSGLPVARALRKRMGQDTPRGPRIDQMISCDSFQFQDPILEQQH